MTPDQRELFKEVVSSVVISNSLSNNQKIKAIVSFADAFDKSNNT